MTSYEIQTCGLRHRCLYIWHRTMCPRYDSHVASRGRPTSTGCYASPSIECLYLNSPIKHVADMTVFTTLTSAHLDSPQTFVPSRGHHISVRRTSKRAKPHFSILSQTNSIHALQLYFPKINLNGRRFKGHKRKPQVPILSHINPIHTPLQYYLKINFNIILPSVQRSKS